MKRPTGATSGADVYPYPKLLNKQCCYNPSLFFTKYDSFFNGQKYPSGNFHTPFVSSCKLGFLWKSDWFFFKHKELSNYFHPSFVSFTIDGFSCNGFELHTSITNFKANHNWNLATYYIPLLPKLSPIQFPISLSLLTFKSKSKL
jgi:hypothetical protein